MPKPPRTQFIASADGTPLMLRHLPRKRPGGWTVLLGHALTVHSGLLGSLSDQLAEAGCDVWAGDLRGHGQSASARAPLAHLDPETGWDRLVDDMQAFARRAFEGVEPEDRVMVGGIMSCQVMLSLLQRQPDVARHLVMAPPTPIRIGATRFAASFLKMRRLTRPVDRPDPQIRHHIYTFLKANLPPGSGDADVISAFPDVVAAILADPRGFPTPTLGYWQAVVPGLQRPWDRIGPGQLDPALRVLLVSADDDPQLRGERQAAQVIDWFAKRGVMDAHYLDLPGIRSNPMVDAAHVPLVPRLIDWLQSGVAPALPVSLAPPAEPSDTSDTVALTDLHQLIQLCYEALEDDSRWIELIYRLSLAGEQDAHRIEQIVQAILPHWQRAYDLQQDLRKAAMLGVIYNDVIDRLDLGVALLATDGSLHHANAAFGAALDRSGLPGDGAPSDRLARLLADQPGWPPPPGQDAPVLCDGRLIGVAFTPASLRGTQSDGREALPWLIVLRGPEAGPAALDHRAGLLSLSFGLTRQEALVALHLTEGLATEAAAARLAISEHTLRSHLKQVFAKMGVTSRTEMAGRIMASPLGWLTGTRETPLPLRHDRA